MPETSLNITTLQNGSSIGSPDPSWLQGNHPDWVIKAGGELPLGRLTNTIGTLNFGVAAAREWMTDYISAAVKEWGLDTFRFEGGCMWGEPPSGKPLVPLDGRQSCRWIWAEADRAITDASPAKGISEAKHIDGFLAFLDATAARNPGLALDSVAGGGLRLEHFGLLLLE